MIDLFLNEFTKQWFLQLFNSFYFIIAIQFLINLNIEFLTGKKMKKLLFLMILIMITYRFSFESMLVVDGIFKQK